MQLDGGHLANEPEVWLFYAWESLKNLVNLLLRWNRGTVDGCYLYLNEIGMMNEMQK